LLATVTTLCVRHAKGDKQMRYRLCHQPFAFVRECVGRGCRRSGRIFADVKRPLKKTAREKSERRHSVSNARCPFPFAKSSVKKSTTSLPYDICFSLRCWPCTVKLQYRALRHFFNNNQEVKRHLIGKATASLQLRLNCAVSRVPITATRKHERRGLAHAK
jgi:hypothetical protein